MKHWLFLLVICLAQPLSAKRIALVIGNGVYDATKPITSKPNLKNTRSDSKLVAATFKSLGFEVILIEDATKMTTLVALNAIKTQGADASLGVVFFSGHGFEVGGNNYLCPVGAPGLRTREDSDKFHVNLNTVLDAMSQARIEAKMVILDCCRNDPFAPAPRAIEVETTAPARAGGMGVVDKIPQSTLIMFAAGPGQTASDGAGNNSPFTEIFSSVIQKPGISCFEAFFQVSEHVKRQTNSRQQPWVKFDGAADAFRKYTFQGTAPAASDSNTGVVSASQQNAQTMQEEVALIQQESVAALANGATPVPQSTPTPQGPSPRDKANNEVSVFLRGWLANQESNSAAAWTSDFGISPKYTYWKGPGGAPLAFLRSDRQELIEKYPVRTYEVIGDATGEFFNNYQEAVVVISYHYEYQGAKKASGNSINTLRLMKIGNTWRVMGYDETVRRNASTPLPSKPSVNSINQVTLAGFSNQWINHNFSNQPSDWVSDFANSVNYCYKKDGPANHPYLQKDRKELIDKFPSRKYEIESFKVLQNDGNRATANLIYRYDYGRVKGRSSITMGLGLINGKILITSYDEKILK
ncbi:caspase family protein [Verrucomicrobiaceae bacterium 227]